MHSSQEWRQEYYYRRGRTIRPCSILDDILTDLETVETENQALRARIEHHKILNSDLQNEIDELQTDLRHLEQRRAH